MFFNDYEGQILHMVAFSMIVPKEGTNKIWVHYNTVGPTRLEVS